MEISWCPGQRLTQLLQRKTRFIVGPPRIGDGDRKAVKKRELVGAIATVTITIIANGAR